MTPRMVENLMKALLFFVMFMVMLFQSIFSNAQTTPRTTCKGFTERSGTRAFMMSSDIDDLNLARIV